MAGTIWVKSMDDIQVINSLMETLSQHAAQHNWRGVMATDKAIAALLRTLTSQPVDERLHQTINQVHVRYQQLLNYCTQELMMLEKKIVVTRENHEGAAAYAAFMSTGE